MGGVIRRKLHFQHDHLVDHHTNWDEGTICKCLLIPGWHPRAASPYIESGVCFFARADFKATMFEFDPLRSKPVRQQILLLGAILTLANLAAIIHKSSRVFLFQQSQCLTYYLIHDPTKVDPRYRVEEELCKTDEIQSSLSMIDGIDSFLSCLPGTTSWVTSSLTSSSTS